MYISFNRKIIKALVIYNTILIITVMIFYYAIPMFLSYPPNSINNKFETMIDMGFKYKDQYIAIVILGMIIFNSLLLIQIRKIKGWENIAKGDIITDKRKKEIEDICFNAPIKLYIILVFVPVLTVFIGLIFTGATISLSINISVCMLAIFMVLALLMYILSKDIFSDVLIKMKNDKKNNVKYNIANYKGRILLQFLPLLILMGALIYLISTAMYSVDKSQLLFEKYLSIIENQNFEDSITINDLKNKLNSIRKVDNEDTLFIIKENEVIYQDTENEISDFFIKYIFNVGNEKHAYGYYASNIQGAYNFIQIDEERYAIGIMYYVNPLEDVMPIIITFIILICVVIVFLLFFANDFSKPILKISESMKELVKGESVDYDKKIPVTSNDELGELTVNFNKILDLEKKHVETIKENQDALVENGRLSSLGQLVGGIAHNLKTPIMSISGNLQGIQDLIVEYDSSIGDSEVMPEDHKAIAKDMQELVDKTRLHLSYMSDVITAIKGQAVQLDSSEDQIFGVLEVISRIEILMRHELKSALIEMDVDVEEDAKTAYIKGDVNSLVQVLNNLIQNSIYAYQGKQHQVINFKVTKEDNKLYFRIQDYGCGIPDNVKEKLFKEMVTTKGKNGTGLGLYMSYSTIKGKFNGGFDFKSEVGKGTTFIISIPVSK